VSGLAASSAVGGVATKSVTGVLAGARSEERRVGKEGGAMSTATADKLRFNVVHGAAAKLVYTSGLADTADLVSGASRVVTVTIEDAAGNTVIDGPDAVLKLLLFRRRVFGTVSGLAASSAVGGVATKSVTGVLAGA